MQCRKIIGVSKQINNNSPVNPDSRRRTAAAPAAVWREKGDFPFPSGGGGGSPRRVCRQASPLSTLEGGGAFDGGEPMRLFLGISSFLNVLYLSKCGPTLGVLDLSNKILVFHSADHPFVRKQLEICSPPQAFIDALVIGPQAENLMIDLIS